MSHPASLSLGVVIVNFNGGDMLQDCIGLLLKQHPLPQRIIVVDNGSEDGSVDCLPQHELIHLVSAGKNLGFAAANNLAFDLLEGVDLVMTLNPDAFVREGCLDAILDAAVRLGRYDSFACRMMQDETTVDGAGDVYHFSGLVWRNGHGQLLSQTTLEEQEVFSACAGAAVYRWSALHEVGGFDESFFCYIEDVDLGYRMKLLGMRCMYIPNAVVDHKGSAISNKYPGFAVYHGHRNLVWAWLKNTPAPILLMMFPAHLLMTLVIFLVCWKRGSGKLFISAKVDAIRGIRRVVRQRGDALRRRRVSLWKLLNSYSYGRTRH